MMIVLYQVSSMYPYYYDVALILIDANQKRIVDTATFTAWCDVEAYAHEHHAILKFDGLI